MKSLFISSILIALIIWGCSNQKEDNPLTTNSTSGKIILSIDEANAPMSVVTVEAILTRDGFDTRSGFLNLLSDSTAEIQLDDIPAGTWHLVVNAMDSSNTILYMGEADVNILAGFITQVNLVLYPTGEGTGSIHIFVTWGFANNNWQDYETNPILQSSGFYWEAEGIAESKVLLDGDLFRMYYLGLAGAGYSYVGYAESNDGITWNKPFSEPILAPSEPGHWDSWSVQAGSILKEDDSYKMYYTGWSDNYGNWDIGLAVSSDGINWTKHPNPVLYGTSGWEFQIGASSVIKHNETYFLFYTGRNLPQYKIGLATSTDGVNFTKYSGNPILTNTEPWENSGVLYPSVIYENNQFKMVYMNSTGTAFGFAYSPDGMNWTKDTNNPFFTKDNTANGWAAVKIAYPNFIKLQNEHRIYYSGYNSNNSLFKIGFMRKLGN